MKHLISRIIAGTILVLSVSGCATTAKYSSQEIDWNWQDLGRGMQAGYAQTNLFNSTQSISVLRYPMSRYTTCIANDTGKEAGTPSVLGPRYEAIAAVNGSYFNMKALTPITFTKDDGVQEGYTTPGELFRTNGLLAIKNGKDVRIFKADTVATYDITQKYQEAIASGPVLLQNGIEPETWPNDWFYTGRHPRTIIGTAKNMVYFIVVDGRLRGNADGATIHECAQIARLFGLEDAINFDGGGSSALWTSELGVLSHPSDNGKFNHQGERVVPNIIYVK